VLKPFSRAWFCVVPVVFFGGPDWAESLFYNALKNLGHILFFFVVTLLPQPQRSFSG
jgi:hypothetical protein